MKTPLIIACVVVLFLAVNFFAFRERLLKIQSVSVSLPVPAPQAKTDAEVSIVVLSGTSCTVAGSVVELANLRGHLVKARAAGKDSVSVKTAPGVSYEPVLAVLDLIRQSGFESVNIDATQPPTS